MSITKSKMRKIRAEINFMKETEPLIKPNFSALAREMGICRQTVARLWNEPDSPSRPRQKKKSKFDPYYEEIKSKFGENACTVKAVFKYFQARYGTSVFSSYDSFKSYVRTNKLSESRQERLKARPRYETSPGEEVQFDWKESLEMKLKDGETIKFNIFTVVYGFSRYVKLVYSRTRTTEDFIRCLLEAVHDAGGLPQKFKTDNMSAIVEVHKGRKTKLPVVRQLEKDMGVPIELCKIKNPQSKGKVESANRFTQWLEPYQGELESEEELIQTIQKINRQINLEPSRTTGQIRAGLMKKEKEYLRPLPSHLVIDSYLQDVDTQVVPPTALVSYKSKGYSVPREMIGKRVKITDADNKLHIYYNGKLICCHEISDLPLNYMKSHYEDLLRDSLPQRGENPDKYQEMIEKKALASLEQMKNLKGKMK